MLLEGTHRGIEIVIEGGVGILPVRAVSVGPVGPVGADVQESETCQSAPNLSDGWSTIAVTKSVHA
ncbi:hypothetical protein NWFMUON74_71510 [Nocardia wallacei]|uniref:Uncharacterized protein n=1 Tax=Nocardia wallacei TaxID=480035 RepID=A0A7G1KZB9_9NOCA|nr:hypothetical protein NWFMUON74_71510 [Nocardia wallacei]